MTAHPPYAATTSPRQTDLEPPHELSLHAAAVRLELATYDVAQLEVPSEDVLIEPREFRSDLLQRPRDSPRSVPERELRVLGHHLRGPGRIEDHLGMDLVDPLELADELPHLL